MPTPRLTPEIIQAAIGGFEARKQRIDAKIAELRAVMNGTPTVEIDQPKPARTRRKFSAAAVQRMREAQQRRWAKVRGEATAPDEAPKAVKPAGKKTKRRLSPEGRKRIIEATKKRWAAVRAAAAEKAAK